VSRHELLSRVREGLVTALDVRPPEEYAAGQGPGAVNIPLAELEQRLKELDKDQEIVAYWLLMPSPDCGKRTSRPSVWKTAIRNGRPKAYRWNPGTICSGPGNP